MMNLTKILRTFPKNAINCFQLRMISKSIPISKRLGEIPQNAISENPSSNPEKEETNNSSSQKTNEFERKDNTRTKNKDNNKSNKEVSNKYSISTLLEDYKIIKNATSVSLENKVLVAGIPSHLTENEFRNSLSLVFENDHIKEIKFISSQYLNSREISTKLGKFKELNKISADFLKNLNRNPPKQINKGNSKKKSFLGNTKKLGIKNTDNSSEKFEKFKKFQGERTHLYHQFMDQKQKFFEEMINNTEENDIDPELKAILEKIPNKQIADIPVKKAIITLENTEIKEDFIEVIETMPDTDEFEEKYLSRLTVVDLDEDPVLSGKVLVTNIVDDEPIEILISAFTSFGKVLNVTFIPSSDLYDIKKEEEHLLPAELKSKFDNIKESFKDLDIEKYEKIFNENKDVDFLSDPKINEEMMNDPNFNYAEYFSHVKDNFNENSAIIEYESIDEAILAREFLNGLELSPGYKIQAFCFEKQPKGSKESNKNENEKENLINYY